MLIIAPRLDEPVQAFPLGILYRLAMFPRINVDALYDLVSKSLAQVVRVHRVKLPAAIAVVILEPGMARVMGPPSLVGGQEVHTQAE